MEQKQARRQLIEFIAKHENFQATLEAFPQLQRDQIESLLLDIAYEQAPEEQKAGKSVRRKGFVALQNTVHIFVDGASRGNPGQAGAGYVILSEDNEILEQGGKYLGEGTNNYAEYQALILALNRAHKMEAKRVLVHSDSELMVRQLKGVYKVKHPTLQKLHGVAKKLFNRFDWHEIKHVRRELNRLADPMANKAIDERLS